jgi:DNA-binding response OmpR family regulator
VLLIEDDPAVREGLQLALSHLGHDVIAAPDGSRAWPPPQPRARTSWCST